MLTIAFTSFLELDGSPNRMNYVVPGPEGDPPTGLEDGTTEKKFEPILEFGEREQGSGKGSDGRSRREGAGNVYDVR